MAFFICWETSGRGLASIEYEEKGGVHFWNRGFDERLLDLEPSNYLNIVYADKNAPWAYPFTVALKLP